MLFNSAIVPAPVAKLNAGGECSKIVLFVPNSHRKNGEKLPGGLRIPRRFEGAFDALRTLLKMPVHSCSHLIYIYSETDHRNDGDSAEMTAETASSETKPVLSMRVWLSRVRPCARKAELFFRCEFGGSHIDVRLRSTASLRAVGADAAHRTACRTPCTMHHADTAHHAA